MVLPNRSIDYKKTFSLVIRFTSMSLILALVVSLDLELHQINVDTTFLNGELGKKISIK